ncbi:hypothetical protein [sulfur-oxidizing endosymbiont of Gigantopelta aegis]|uniref:hypothetical protein n=1 Tax=sulfur-oxidizing endosymbiont of Gigantopelta aegis TaxID=2794934 RepID=UPI0018DD1FD9|nr:hypothetical protein [sulfur-oxidizing endosymbiont of Gigantopelta aegis]
MTIATANAAAFNGVDADKPIVALYETRQIKIALQPQLNKQQWQFWRSKNRVEKSYQEAKNMHKNEIEIWEKNAQDISFSHVFLEQQRIIEYNAGDLRSLGQVPNWDRVQHLISPELLNQLTKTASLKVLGYEASQYSGQIQGVDLTVIWIDDLQLPAMIRQIKSNMTYSVHLLAIYPQEKSPWKRAEIEHFLTMDFADLGDNEADPIWASLGNKHH